MPQISEEKHRKYVFFKSSKKTGAWKFIQVRIHLKGYSTPIRRKNKQGTAKTTKKGIQNYTKLKTLVNKNQWHSKTRKFQKGRDQRKSKKNFFITDKNENQQEVVIQFKQNQKPEKTH